jgi:hypothetical protein
MLVYLQEYFNNNIIAILEVLYHTSPHHRHCTSMSSNINWLGVKSTKTTINHIRVKSSLYFFLVIFNLYFGTFEFGARDM